MGRVLPFPLWRRTAYVRTQGAFLASLGYDAAERSLARQLDMQRRLLLRRGINRSTTEAQVAALAAAIRAEALRLTHDGAA